MRRLARRFSAAIESRRWLLPWVCWRFRPAFRQNDCLPAVVLIRDRWVREEGARFRQRGSSCLAFLVHRGRKEVAPAPNASGESRSRTPRVRTTLECPAGPSRVPFHERGVFTFSNGPGEEVDLYEWRASGWFTEPVELGGLTTSKPRRFRPSRIVFTCSARVTISGRKRRSRSFVARSIGQLSEGSRVLVGWSPALTGYSCLRKSPYPPARLRKGTIFLKSVIFPTRKIGPTTTQVFADVLRHQIIAQ